MAPQPESFAAFGNGIKWRVIQANERNPNQPLSLMWQWARGDNGRVNLEKTLRMGDENPIWAAIAIPIDKAAGYALNPEHPIGKDKARVFASVLGFTKDDAQNLIDQIRQSLPMSKAVSGQKDKHGQRFTVDVPVVGKIGTGVVRTGWILTKPGETPKLTTMYVLKGENDTRT
jgi:hypothetical protein